MSSTWIQLDPCPPHTNTLGFASLCAREVARFLVPWTRLSRIAFLLASVQRPTTLSPARWITASNPETTLGSRGTLGSQEIWSGLWARVRTSRITLVVVGSNDATRALPIGPEAPLIRIRFTGDSNSLCCDSLVRGIDCWVDP